MKALVRSVKVKFCSDHYRADKSTKFGTLVDFDVANHFRRGTTSSEVRGGTGRGIFGKFTVWKGW